MFYNGFIHREPWEQLCRRYMRSTEYPSSLFLLFHCIVMLWRINMMMMVVIRFAALRCVLICYFLYSSCKLQVCLLIKCYCH